jgi:hypothetical protein
MCTFICVCIILLPTTCAHIEISDSHHIILYMCKCTSTCTCVPISYIILSISVICKLLCVPGTQIYDTHYTTSTVIRPCNKHIIHFTPSPDMCNTSYVYTCWHRLNHHTSTDVTEMSATEHDHTKHLRFLNFHRPIISFIVPFLCDF